MTYNLPDRYKFTGNIEHGGMSEIIVCEDENLKRKVVIKFIKNENDRARITDEIDALKRLQNIRSKHVVQVFDLFFDESSRKVGIVQEFVEGDDLKSIIKKESFSREQYLKTLYQIVSGIDDIHQQDLIHRDIKPNNIKFDSVGLIKIYDFGLTRVQNLNNSTLGFKGTQAFAAPELYGEGFVHFTQAIDIYAFGVTARYIAQAELEEEFSSFSFKNSPKPSFASISIDIPLDLVQLLDKTLSIEPEKRPTAQEIRQLIGNHLLHGKHRALLISSGESYTLGQTSNIVDLEIAGAGKLTIKYDGLKFYVMNLRGSVTVNRRVIGVGDALPNNCVITFESDQSRTFITFDISNPEVVL